MLTFLTSKKSYSKNENLALPHDQRTYAHRELRDLFLFYLPKNNHCCFQEYGTFDFEQLFYFTCLHNDVRKENIQS